MLHHDLVEQADHLARRETKRPRQASLRRAVSAAYYAMFHSLVTDATALLVPNRPSGLRLQARRAFSHRDMRSACEAFVTQSTPTAHDRRNPRRLMTLPLEPEIVEIAKTFVALQDARHDADYNLSERFDRVRVLAVIERAKQAISRWNRIRAKPNGQVFLTALVLQNRWRR